jgi:hypothetical protein
MPTDNQLNYSAIGSYSGYLYQGYCAIYHALKLIFKDKEQCMDYKLKIEVDSDFSVTGPDDRIVSIHQCKCYSKSHDFKEDIKLLKEVKKDRMDQGLCGPDCKLWFHTNLPLDLTGEEEVRAYRYHNEEKFVIPSELIDLMEGMLNNITVKYGTTNPVGVQYLLGNLMEFIHETVFKVHQVSSQNNVTLRQATRDYSYVTIQDLWNKIETRDNSINPNAISNYVFGKVIAYLYDFIEFVKNKDKDTANIEKFADVFSKLEDDKKMEALKRFYPHFHYENDFDAIGNYTNEDSLDALFDLVQDAPELSESLDWLRKGQYETPTGMRAESNIERICQKILRNPNNNTILREYDWLVANIEEKVPNIKDACKDITTPYSSPDSRSIFEMKSIGILPVKIFKADDY